MSGSSANGSPEGGSLSKESPAGFMKLSQTDFEIDFFSRVLQRAPDNTDVLKILGNHYTAKGMYTRGLQIDKRLVKLLPNDGTVWYNLACSYALLHLNDLAITSLTRSIELGYDDVEHMMNDHDLDNLRDDPRFKKLARKIRRRRRAT